MQITADAYALDFVFVSKALAVNFHSFFIRCEIASTELLGNFTILYVHNLPK